jgi:hypothetical protein
MRLPPSARPGAGLLLDLLLVIVFAAIGRASHSEANPVLGALLTAWPFMVGTLLGWVVVRVMRRRWPLEPGPGITVWFATLVLGMVLRRATGAGTAWPFVVVAAVTLAVLLLGWRAIGRWWSQRYAARPAPHEAEPPRAAG